VVKVDAVRSTLGCLSFERSTIMIYGRYDSGRIRMATLEVNLHLPAGLAKAAKDAGLLTPQALEGLLWDALRRKATDELFETADRLADANIRPMTMDQIQVEVDAVGKARRERAVVLDHRLK
jgi:hypothetical protein